MRTPNEGNGDGPEPLDLAQRFGGAVELDLGGEVSEGQGSRRGGWKLPDAHLAAELGAPAFTARAAGWSR